MSRINAQALPEPVKRGQVHPKDYLNDEYTKQLQPLVAALHEEAPEAKYDAKALVVQLVQLLHFQEAAFGKDAMPPKAMPKLPIKLVTDPAVGGALHAVALKLHDIRRQRGLKAIEWQHPGKRKECVEIALVLRRELQRRKLLRDPLVHVSASLPPEVAQRQREYVRRLQGNLAERPDEPGVTHVVCPFGPGGDPDDGGEYTTLLAIKGKQARVHYWYQPDSYDEWIPVSAVDNKDVVPDRQPPGGVWKVTPRWADDSAKFNEWMNPADYTTPEMDAELEAAEKGGQKAGKRAGAALAGQAKKAKSTGELEVAAEPLAVLGPTARLRRLLVPPKGLGDPRAPGIGVENLSQGQLDTHLSAYLPPLAPQPQPAAAGAAAAAAAAAGGEGSTPADEEMADAQQQEQQEQQEQEQQQQQPADALHPPDPQQQQQPGQDQQPARVSTVVAAGWFRWGAVHALERAAVPEFFNATAPDKTPEAYVSYRDAMLQLHLQAPGQRLRFADVRATLHGEVNSLLRIFEALEGWGLINHQLGGGLQQPALPLPTGPRLSPQLPPGTACLFDFQQPSRLEATAAAQAGGNFGGAAALAARGDGGRLLVPPCGRRGPDEGLRPSVLSRIECSARPGTDITRLRYHCTRHPHINISPEAFAEGCFPPGCSSRDFVRIQGHERHASSDGWRPEETLLLLEGVELHKEDWAAISAHVGTRSQQACLAHFVRLPIDDALLDDVAAWGEGAGQAGTTSAAVGGAGQQQQQQAQQQQQPGQQQPGGQLPPLPFQDEPNPLLSMLGVLTTVMGPKVAAAAAQRALGVLAEGDAGAGRELHVAARLAAGVSGEQQAADAAAPQPEQPEQQDLGRRLERPLVLAAYAAGLRAAATRAQQLAATEEREMQRLCVMLVDAAARRVDAKAKLLASLCDASPHNPFDRERLGIEAALKPMALEYSQLSERRKQAEAVVQHKAAAQQAAKQRQEAQRAAAAAAAQQQQAQQKAAAAAAAAQQQRQQQEAAAAAAAAAAAGQGGSQPQPASSAPGTSQLGGSSLMMSDDGIDDEDTDMP